jgi:hypothetical protein
MPAQTLAHHQLQRAPLPQPEVCMFPTHGPTKQRFLDQETDTRGWTSLRTKESFQTFANYTQPNPTPCRYGHVSQVPNNYLGVSLITPPFPGGREYAVPRYAPAPVPPQYHIHNSTPPKQFLQIG